VTLSLSSVLELGGKRAARVGVVSARQEQLASTQRVLTLDVLAAVTRQFIAVLAAQEQVTLRRQAEQLAQQTRALLANQVAAALTPEAELLRADATLAQAAIAIDRAAQVLRSERIRLSAYWAEPEPEFTTVQADLFALAPAIPLNDLLLQLDKNPDLALLATAVQLHTAELQEAETLRDPNLQWNAGIRRLQSTADTAFVVGVSVPLGTAPRAAGAITTALANRANAELLRDNARLQLQAEVRSLFEAWNQAAAEVSALQTSVLPPLTAALAATEAAFEQGRYSFLELNLAQRQLLETREAMIAAAARAHMLATDIERLTGATLRADPVFIPQLFPETPL
jgi:outer membrane protein, heavy metal efflux system